jgi:DNA-dependent RNA polymerase auxiliary subunit epsilon
MAELFGFRITRSKDEGTDSVILPTSDDGAGDIAGGGFYSQFLDIDGRDRTEADLIRRYCDIAQQPECDMAVEDIINESIVSDEKDQSVSLITDRLPYQQKVKNRIREEFDSVLRLLDFNSKGHDIFRRWYVDGRIYFHKIIDKNAPEKGVTELRYIDPRKIKKVRQVIKDRDDNNTEIIKGVEEFYIYNEKGIDVASGTSTGLKITSDSIAYCPSGVIDAQKGTVLSHLHKAIKAVNQLRMIEDSLVIYRISRAPERRIFYIDVGNLPKVKAEQYLKDVMNRYRNKMVYDANTGEIRDDRNHMSMLEDFWLPRREGGRGTEISTLPGGSNLGEIDDITYFQRKLYRSLNVPISRLEAESGFSLGRSTEITRDELKFTKFVQKLRKKFSVLFIDILRTQLILKGVISAEEWDMVKEHIQFDYLQDGHFSELKKSEMMREKLDMLSQIESYVGTYFSKEWVRKNVLHMTDEEIEEIETQIENEGGDEDETGDEF